MTSDRLYGLGIQLMERATAEVSTTGSVSEQHAKLHRDGLLIALLAAIPLRRRAVTNLRIGKQLVRSGSLWALDIPAEDTKTRRSLEYSISPALSAYIDTYLLQFRRRIPGADSHDGLWPSMQGRPMCANTILQSITLRTRAAFGFSVSPHRFRHAAATFWQMHDPENVMGSKDLLGHASFRMTEKHYIMAQSRIAGRELARVIGRLKGDRAAAVESVFQHLSDNGAPIDGDHPVLS